VGPACALLRALAAVTIKPSPLRCLSAADSPLRYFMSVVKFLCPNGHQLNAPLNLVGKAGKCPKCGTAFVVPAPEPEEPEPQPVTKPAAGGSGKLASDSSGGSSPRLDIKLGSGIKPAQGAKPSEEIFVFLCPNGHKLNGPPTLKGKLGQCPHCGAKFRIPEDEPEPEIIEGGEIVDELPEADAVEEISPDQLEIEEPEPPFEEGVHPLAHIIGRLWRHKGESGELELLLPEGEIMQPEHFSPSLSASDYGVFATREGQGFSFSVIPWANVRRVNVHKVEQLPPGAFPE